MSKIEELIQKLCPNGVEYKKLKDIGNFFGGLSGKSKADFIDGNAKFITYMNVYSNPSINLKVEDTVRIDEGEKQNIIAYGDVLFTTSSETPDECGMSSVVTEYPKEKFYLNSFCFGFRMNDLSLYNVGFLKHLFRSNLIRKVICRCASGVTRFNVSKKKMERIEIPFPPVEIQEEIVRILDKFTAMSDKLNAELELRKKQYEYYRERLISSTRNSESIKLGDLCKIQRGVRVVKKQLEESGEYPVYQNSLEPLGFYDKSNYPANTSFIICGGAAGSIGFSNVDFWAADDCFCFISSDNLNDKYLFYVLKANQIYFDSRVRKAGVPRLSRNSIENFEMALPPLVEQERIVSILDKFDTLINDQEKGLPAEIRKVQQQYEYYRDKLLTF